MTINSAKIITESEQQPAKVKRRFSVVSRLAGSTALLATAVVLLAIIFSQAFQGNFFKGAFETPLEEWSTMMASRIGSDHEMAQAVAMRHQLWLVVSTEEGFFAYGPSGEPANHEQLQQQASQYRRINVAGPHGEQISIFMDGKRFARSQVPLLVGLIALLLVTIAVIYAFQLSQLRPLRWLRDGVDAVSRGDFSTRVPIVRQDEIGLVGQAFNHMTGRVEKMISNHEYLMADVSHELRSPLARIKVALEFLPEGDKRDSISRDVLQMEALISMLLEREQVRHRAEQPEKVTVDLVVMIREITHGFEQQSPGINLTGMPAGLDIQADPALLRVLVQNLIDNAVKFSLPDSRPIAISLNRDDDRVQLVIDDDGPGIPENEIERVFEPFVKLDPARGHRSGYGLGLNICQRIVQAHNGSIRFVSPAKRGAQVVVSLPA